MNRPISTVQLAIDVLRDAPEPMSFQELLDAANAASPIPTRNPASTLRGAISSTHLIERTADGRYGYLPALISGSTVRHLLSLEDLTRPYLNIAPDARAALWPAIFEVQTRQEQGPREFRLPDGRQGTAPLEFFGSGIWGFRKGPVLQEWLNQEGAEPGDSLLLHVPDGRTGHCRLLLEAERDRDLATIDSRNQELAEVAYRICNR